MSDPQDLKKAAAEFLEQQLAANLLALDKGVCQSLARMGAAIALRPQAAAQEAKPAQPPKAEVIHLPFWTDDKRGTPNCFLRSALFGVVRKGHRQYLERQEMPALDGIKIIYTGPRLDQGDLDVWETALHILRQEPLGNDFRVTAYRFLKLLGKSDAGSNRTVLDRQLSRLKATAVEIQVGRYSYEGSLIDEVYRDKDTLEYVIRLNPKLRSLFECDQWTAADWAVRMELAGHPLAQWLHGFYATHAAPYPVLVETLHRLCGSETSNLSHFRQDLRKALDAVMVACQQHSQSFQAVIRNDLVAVSRSPSPSQARHLRKKANKKPQEKQAKNQRRNNMTAIGDLLKPKK